MLFKDMEVFCHFSLFASPILAGSLYAFWSADQSVSYDFWQHILVFVAAVAWSTTVVFALPNMVGLFFGPTHRRDQENITRLRESGWDTRCRLILCYVAKGENPKTLNRAISRSLKVLEEFDTNYRVEVVTDIPCDLIEHPHVHHFLVPEEFETPKGSRFKARALTYLSEERVNRFGSDPGNWILHFDEESELTSESLAGVHRFMSENIGSRIIGQGEIQYNAEDYGRHWLITACDSVRTGDDIGRFRAQFKIANFPLFGMHGSYVLLPEEVERQVTFDVGSRGSITEDAYMAFQAAAEGVTFGWVDGAVREKSPHTLLDLIKQRRRWFCGLWLLATDRRFSRKHRFVLSLGMLVWTVSFVCPILAISKILLAPGGLPIIWGVILGLLHGGFFATYMLGCFRQLRFSKQDMIEDSVDGWPVWKKLWILGRTAALVPVATLVEASAVVLSLVRPVKGFYVVGKDRNANDRTLTPL